MKNLNLLFNNNLISTVNQQIAGLFWTEEFTAVEELGLTLVQEKFKKGTREHQELDEFKS